MHGRYAMAVTVDGSVADIDRRVRALLKDEGFGVLTEIDVAATLEEKIGVERPPYRILGACNPTLAARALAVREDIGVMLPCNVALYEHGDATVVSIFDPIAMTELADEPALDDVAKDARARLERVIDALARDTSR